jgi:hypothetical protein
MAEVKVCQIAEKQKIVDKLGNRFWRLNNLYWILDEQGNKIKFKLNAVQYTLYTAMWWLNIVLKSRQHGITTFVCIYFLDACLFNSNTRAGIIAHRMDDAKRIFRDKVKFAYDSLPEVIKQARKLTKDDACELMLDNNSSIYVSVSMRSGTLQYLHISEYGYVCANSPGKAKEIKSGALETVHAGGQIIIESTAEGMGNDFHRMCEDALKLRQSGKELTTMDYRFHFFPWYLKPENVLSEISATSTISQKLLDYFAKIEAVTGDKIDLPHRLWYAKKKAVLHSDMFKEHPSTPEESFMASLEGAYVGHEMIKAKEDNRIGFFPYDKTFKVFTFWDIGSIHTAIWFWQFIRGEIRCLETYYDNTGMGLAELIKYAQERPYVYAGENWCGWDLDDKSGSNRKNPVSGNMIKDEAESLGWKFTPLPKYPFKDRIAAMRNVLELCRFNQSGTEIGVSALFNYRQSKNEALSTEDRTVFNKDPEPGPECHIADAFGHGALAYFYHIKLDGLIAGHMKSLKRIYHPELRQDRVDLLEVA